MTADDGRRMLDAGADLLQVYTGFIYSGPALVDALNRLDAAPRGAIEPSGRLVSEQKSLIPPPTARRTAPG